MSWAELGLDEIGTVSRGRSRHRPRDAEHLYGGPYPFIQTGDVKHAGLYLYDYGQTYSDAGLAQSKIWPEGTLCITIAANIAETSILKISACFPDSVIGFIPDDEKSDARFVKYLFDAVLKKRYQAFTQGAAQDNLSQGKLLSLKFPIPDLDVQKRIADTLSTYDDLIENNRRRIALFEDAAEKLYKEWFVYFRFPGHEHVKIVDGVPEGWARRPFSELADFLNGFAFKPHHLVVEGYPVVKIPELKNGVTAKTPRNSGEDVPEKYHLKDGDLLFSWSGTLAVNQWSGGPALLNQHLFKVTSKGQVSDAFLMEALRQAMPSFLNETTGATMKHIRRSALDKVCALVPPLNLLAEYEETAVNLYKQSLCLSRQINCLTHARDLLLPKLMSGEIAA